MGDLCTRSEALVAAYGRSTGLDVSGSDVDTAISDAENEIYSDWEINKVSQFQIVSTRTQYEFRKDRSKTYSISKIFIKTPNVNHNQINRNEVVSGSYTGDTTNNKITLTSGQVSGWNGSIMEVHFIPQEFNNLAKKKAALNIIDSPAVAMQPGDTNTEVPRVSRLAKGITRIEHSLSSIEVVGSYENILYDRREDIEWITQKRFNPTA